MAGFRFKKAEPQQAYVKLGIYGAAGSGKTATSLLFAEGLANLSGKRVAYIDTERGTDFYCQDVPTRGFHPKGFDFDALYTRSISDALEAVRSISSKEHGVIVIDSITHIWEAAKEAYSGKLTKYGEIPMNAWGKIKKPYMNLINLLINSDMHAIICGRQGTDWDKNESTGEMVNTGFKMKAEGQTAYEPHILIRMMAKPPKNPGEASQVIAMVEKDRTGVLSGKQFLFPTFDTVMQPIVGLLGGVQAKLEPEDETAIRDADAIELEEAQKAKDSAECLRQFTGEILCAKDQAGLKAVGQKLTPAVKKSMTQEDLAELRSRYANRESEIRAG